MAKVLPDTTVTAQFVLGSVSGNGGCNQYSFGYKVDGNKLTVRPQGASTAMMCAEPPGVMDQEQAYLAALSKAARTRSPATCW